MSGTRCIDAALFAVLLSTAAKTAAAPTRIAAGQLTASTACLAGFSFAECLHKLRQLGFGGVEILTYTGARHSVGPIPGAVVAELGASERQRLRRIVGGFRSVSTHLPFHGLFPAAQDSRIRQSAQDRIYEAVEDSGFWGASIGTAHAAAEPGQALADARRELIPFFRRLGDLAAKRSMRIGIETGWPNTVADYVALIRDIDHEHVGATIDTGHIRSYRADIGVGDHERPSQNGITRYNDVLLRIVDEVGPKLFHFHFDDVRATDWRDHRTLGGGIVDWTRLLRRISSLGYSGTFALELEEPDAVAALQQSRGHFRRVLTHVQEPRRDRR